MKSQFKTLIGLVPAAALVLAFQNCSSPKFSTTSTSEKALGATDDGTGDSSTNDGNSSDSNTSSDNNNNSSSDNNHSSSSHDGDCDGKKSGDTGKSGSGDTGKSGSDSSKSPSDNYNGYVQACADVMKSGLKVAAMRDINNGSGSSSYLASSFGKINNGSGKIALGCTADAGSVQSVEAGSGVVLLCGCDVSGDIHNGSGLVIVVNGDVKGNVTNGSGLIKVSGSIDGSVHNGSGAITGQ